MMATLFLIVTLFGGWWLYTPDLDRASLEAEYARPPSRYVDAAGIRLHVRESGPADAPALVLLHGFGSSLHTWETWASSLSDRYRVVRIDLPAAGLTGADPSGDYSDLRAVRVISSLLDQLGLARVTLVGHSMGGRIAWRYAVEQPQRVERLVLLAPDGFASPTFQYGKAPDVTPMIRLMQVALPRSLVSKSLEPAYGDPGLMSEEAVTRLWDLIRAPGVRGALVQRLQQTVLQDPLPLLRRITAPTLLVWGDKDALIPPANAQDYLAAIAGSRLVMLPGIGHQPQEERPEIGLAAVREFLDTR